MRRFAGSFALLLAVTTAASCSGSESSDGSGNPPRPLVRKTGRVLMKVKMPTPEADAAEVEPYRATLEVNGVKLADDLSEVTFDARPLGWPIRLGDEITWVEKDGYFTIGVAEGGPEEWTLYDPTRQPYASVDWGKGKVSDLVPEGETPSVETEIGVLFRGGCGMDGEEDPSVAGSEHCGPEPLIRPMPEDHHGAHAASEPAAAAAVPSCCAGKHDAPSAPSAADETSFSKFPSGTEKHCGDDDGPLFTGMRTHRWKRFFAYLGSTCQGWVQLGCCLNEGGTMAELASATLLDSKLVACSEVHHGRQCQELSFGHIEVQPTTETTEVPLGGTMLVNVHNNGCQGYTIVVHGFGTQLGGTLTSPYLKDYQLEHWDFPDKTVSTNYFQYRYKTDRNMTYTAPKCVTEEQLSRVDDWRFIVDASWEYRAFKISHTSLFRFKSGGMIFSGAGIAGPDKGCPGMHFHGPHPCTDAPDPAPENCGHGEVEAVP